MCVFFLDYLITLLVNYYKLAFASLYATPAVNIRTDQSGPPVSLDADLWGYT